MNILFYVPFDLLKLYLGIYFWRLSMNFLELITLSNPDNLSKFTIVLFLIMIYQVVQNIFMALYWILPGIFNILEWTEKDHADLMRIFANFQNITFFLYMSTGLVQGWVMLGYIHFIWKNTQNLDDDE